MAEIRINATGGVKFYDADDSHYAQILAGTITSNVDALTLGHASADFNIPVKVLGTTPTLTIGDAGAEDTKIVFDGNAQDFYIALDDSADDLLIGLGSTVGTTPAIAIDENLKVNIPVTTASTSASTGSLTTGGGAGIGADLYVGDDTYLITDSAVLGFGADKDTLLTHTDGTGLTLNSTNKLCFNDASQFVQGSSATVLSIGATDEIDLTATAVDLNGTLNVSGVATFQATPVFPDGSLALADLDIDGGTDIGAAIVDADLFIVDDGAGGTNRKVTASRIKTYAGFTAASITGGTDYGNIPPATGDSIIMHDTSASALREITIANLGNTPAFSAYDGGADSVSNATWTKGQFSGEHYDTHSAFDSSTNYRFTVPTGCGGNYIFSYAASVLNLADAKVHQMHLYINGSVALNSNTMLSAHNSHTKKTAIRGSCMISLDEDDYVELFHYHNHGSAIDTLSERMHFSGFRLVGS